MSGELPDGWRFDILANLTEQVKRGAAPSYSTDATGISAISQKCVRDGIIDLSACRPHNPSKLIPAKAYLRPGDVCVNSTGTGTLGRVALWEHESAQCFADTHVTIVRPDQAKVDPFMLAAFLGAPTTKDTIYRECVTGSTNQIELNASAFSQLVVPVPPLNEQRRIAEVLRAVDEAIAAAEDAAELAEDLLVRVRDEIISRPIWETITLSDATSGGLFTDGDWVESKDQDPGGEVRLIQLADIGDGRFTDKSRRYLTMEKAHELRCTFLKEGDLLIARMPDPLGRCCLFPAINQPSVTVVDVCVVRASQITSNRYLHHALATSEFRSQVWACASGTTRTRVSRGNLGQLELAMPPLTEQAAIADELDQISIVASEQRQAAEQLRDLMHILMSDLLSGHVRVPA